MVGRPINEDRQLSIELGLKTYTGMMHMKCGTRERYVKGGSCVRCSKLISLDQREALKFLKAHPEGTVDNAAAPEVEDDAAARREADIDELM